MIAVRSWLEFRPVTVQQTIVCEPRLDRDYLEYRSSDDPELFFKIMRFRLTYSGNLPPASKGNTQTQAKWAIRKHLHPQLSDLYEQEHILSGKPRFLVFTGAGVDPTGETITSPKTVGAYQFVPLIRKSLSMVCDLDITFLRPGEQGSVVSKGDLDHRLTTLFDGLKMPGETDMAHSDGISQPFYVLMDDDSLITSLTVRTDRLLSPPPGVEYPAILLVDVTIRIQEVTPDNYRFAGLW